MMKREIKRAFTFSDAALIEKAKEKIGFIRRDIHEFANYGVTTTTIDDFENQIDSFSNSTSDIEKISDQVQATSNKVAKAEELRVAIRGIMTRAELVFGGSPAKYSKFGTKNLSLQPDNKLVLTGKRVSRVATEFFLQLQPKGLTQEMIDAVGDLASAFEMLILESELAAADRDVKQEERVLEANAIYSELIDLANIGRNIWETSSPARYNDYIVYNTPAVSNEI